MNRLLLILTVFSLILFGCSGKKPGESRKKGDRKKTILVETGEITVKLEETGEIQPIKDFDIKSKVSGKVITFFIEEGDYVVIGHDSSYRT